MSFEEIGALSALLERAPLAGFLALTLAAVMVLFLLLMREKNAHQETIREVVALTSAISDQWRRQLDARDDRKYSRPTPPQQTPAKTEAERRGFP